MVFNRAHTGNGRSRPTLLVLVHFIQPASHQSENHKSAHMRLAQRTPVFFQRVIVENLVISIVWRTRCRRTSGFLDFPPLTQIIYVVLLIGRGVQDGIDIVFSAIFLTRSTFRELGGFCACGYVHPTYTSTRRTMLQAGIWQFCQDGTQKLTEHSPNVCVFIQDV